MPSRKALPILLLPVLACRPSGGADPVAAAGDRAAGAGAPVELFADAAEASGLRFVHANGMSGEHYIPEIMGPGGGFLDYDNDGDLDLYLVQGGSLVAGLAAEPGPRDRLYRNDLELLEGGERRLHFTDVTEPAGLRAYGYGMGIATGDYDNDGWVDIYLTNFGPNQLWRNRGDGTFVEVTEEAGAGDRRWSVAATFFDYDRDGWLDLYVGNYLDYRLADAARCQTRLGRRDYCGPHSSRPQADRLLRNRGNGSFEDVSAASGIRGGLANTLGVVAADFDQDGWLDLYVANDGLPNLLWVNQRDGTFVDDALLAGCAVNAAGRPEASMGVDVADVDNDGDEDLFLAHLDEETNTLYRNRGDGTFADGTAASGLGPPSFDTTGFGTAFVDLDGDGRLDLVVVNGAINVIEEQAQAGVALPLRQRNQLFRNLGAGRFEEIGAEAGAAFGDLEVSRGAAVGDVDNDGDSDLLLLNNEGPARLLLNRSLRRQAWIGMRVLGESAPRDMLGAWVGIFRRGSSPLWRRVRTSGSYVAAHDPRLLVGLGEAIEVERITVRWPHGGWEEYPPLEPGHYHELRAGEGRPLAGRPE